MSPNAPHLMTLADLSVKQIQNILTHSLRLKNTSLKYLRPSEPRAVNERLLRQPPPQSLAHSSIALLFSKRSTRTRVSAETAAVLLGGRALFLGREDIQLGVNESARDTARVLGGMCQGIFARVGEHSEIEVSCRLPPSAALITRSRNLPNTRPSQSSMHSHLSGIQPKFLLIFLHCMKKGRSRLDQQPM
jgi:ornithine carbamoyltransferase